MKKVKILSSYYEDILEQEINDFIETHDVRAIQLQVSGGASKVYACLITYDDFIVPPMNASRD